MIFSKSKLYYRLISKVLCFFIIITINTSQIKQAEASKFGQVTIKDTSGNTVGVTSNNLDVNVADINRSFINRHVAYFSGTTSNLNANASIGATSLTVVSDTSFSVGDWINITEGTVSETDYLKITAKPGGNVLTLDRPIDNAYSTTTPAVVELVDVDESSANGSLGVPVSYILQPPSDEVWHILRLLITIQDGSIMDTAKFGGATALVNGVVVRIDNNGTKNTLTNWKSNSDMMEDAYDVVFHTKAPSGSYGLAMRWSPSKGGAYIHLDGTTGDFLEVLIQDNLTVLENFEIKAQGHVDE